MFPVTIKDAVTGNAVKVTSRGQLITGILRFDETEFRELAEPDVAYNFYTPVSGWQFIMTGVTAKADKQVSSTVDATVIIYEASSPTTTTVDKVLYQTAMVEGDVVTVLPLNILSAAGKYINAKTTDDDIHMTIMGYKVRV